MTLKIIQPTGITQQFIIGEKHYYPVPGELKSEGEEFEMRQGFGRAG